jgi:alpha,alpha-trehalase
MHWIMHLGLLRYKFNETAAEISSRWTALNDKVFRDTGKITVKYDVMETDLTAGGGEYSTQDGFGWTNRVYLSLKP